MSRTVKKEITNKSDVYVYIAGKYTDETSAQIEQHILAAKEIAIKCANNNIKFFCPHTHTAHFEEYSQNTSWQYYMDLCHPILREVCNTIVMVPNWRDSKGAKYELELAETYGLIRFSDDKNFFEWYETLRG